MFQIRERPRKYEQVQFSEGNKNRQYLIIQAASIFSPINFQQVKYVELSINDFTTTLFQQSNYGQMI